MGLSKEQRAEISLLLKTKIKEKLDGYERESKYMPFLSKLVQNDELVAAYSFIQSLATTLGMSIYESVAVIIAKPTSEEAKDHVKVSGTLNGAQISHIDRIVSDLRDSKRKLNPSKESKEILAINNRKGKDVKKNRVADFYMKRGGIEYYFEIKTAKPNIDVFTESKMKLLQWVARRQKKIRAVLALPYNPYYPEPYSRFTEQGLLKHSTEFMIGGEFWDFLGGKETYNELLPVFDEVGKDVKDSIRNKIADIANKTKI